MAFWLKRKRAIKFKKFPNFPELIWRYERCMRMNLEEKTGKYGEMLEKFTSESSNPEGQTEFRQKSVLETYR